jgi:hypothetical protein
MFLREVKLFLAATAAVLLFNPCPAAAAQGAASAAHQPQSVAARSPWLAQAKSRTVRPGPVTPADLALKALQNKTNKAHRFANAPLPISSSIFLTALDFNSAGQDSHSVAYGDLNGDGKVDMVLADQCASNNNCSNGSVSVLLGNGDGTFQTAVSYNSGGEGTLSVVLGDVNGDGKLDAIVANSCNTNNSCTDGSVTVLLGNGDGTFQTAVSYDSGANGSQYAALGDVNGDGKPDVVVANNCYNNSNCTDGGMSVLLGNGDGTFQTAVIYDSGGEDAMSVALADVNGDGKPDAVVANNCASNSNCSNGSISVLLGNGDGTFQTAVSYSSGGEGAVWVALADVNGDGKPDAVVANNCTSNSNCTAGYVGVLLGNGDGTLQSAVGYSSGGDYASAVAIADINGDGKLDLVVSNQSDSDGDWQDGAVASVLLGNGDGTFQAPVSYASGDYDAASVGIVDVNGDQKLDVVMANQCIDDYNCINGALTVMLGNGDGTLNSGVNYSPSAWDSYGVTIADVNGDGKPDLLVASVCNNPSTCNNGAASVLLGNGDGTFQTAVDYSSGGVDAFAIVSADVNGDGKPDLLVGNACVDSNCAGSSVSVLLGNGDGTFQTAVAYGTGGLQTYSIAVADVNGDGKPDLLVANECATNDCSNGSVAVLLGNGDGTFQTAVNYSSGAQWSYSIAVADVNGDGNPDLLVANECLTNSNCSNGVLSVLLGNGDGTFQTAVTYNSGGYYAYAVAVGDMNGDGKPDLVVANQCGNSNNCTAGSIGVLLGNGDGTFQTATTTATPVLGWLQSIVLADFNGDHKIDVASGVGNVLLLGNGDGSLQSPIPLGASGSALAVGDVNGDGRPDLAVGGVTVLLNTSDGFVFPTTTTVASSANPSAFGASVTFTATVTAQLNGTLSGTVTFSDGATVLGQGTLTSGTASFSTSSLTAGSHSITASYSGNSGFTGSVSTALTQVVQQPNPAFTLTSSTLSPTSVAPGSSAHSTITITPAGGFNPSSATLACSVSPKVTPAVTCSLGAITITNGTGSSTLTVGTTGPVAALENNGAFTKLVFALLMPGLFVCGAGMGKSNRRKLLTVGFICLVLTGCMLQTACVGASSGNKTTTTPGTPAGTYTVTVTGSSGAIQQTTAVSLTVQ